MQWPGTGTILPNQTFYVYQQAFAAGITLGTGQGAGIQAWLGYSSENTDPSTWTNWIEAPYFGEAGNNDEYRTDLGTIMSIPGTYYYASRFKLNNQAYVYGGFQSGFWNGTSNISGVLTVNAAPTINWANLQWPPNGSATVGNDYNVYARVYAPTVTPGAGHGAGIQAWIGYSTENSNPNTWTNWVSAVYQGDDVDNDEYYANIGTAISTPGTYYYASRFQLNTQGYVYGGYNGGYWDGTNNVSGVFTANATSRTLNLNVMLEGLFVSESNTMHEANNDPGNPQYGVGIADHITVELHNSSDYSAVEYTATDVVLHTDGTASVAVPAIYSGSYFITIVHRNSLTSTSAVPVSFADATVAYNFSDAASKAYGNNLKLVGTTYVVYAGDLNQDGVVDGNDLVLVDNNAATFLTGYKVTDVNGDGVIDSSDIGIVTGNVNSFVAVKKP